MPRLGVSLTIAALAVFLGASVWLVRTDTLGPHQISVVLEGGVPATLILAGDAGGPSFPPPPPPPRDRRPPALVLVHGYAGDQLGLAALARSVARQGYTVLTLDLRGHGANRNRFSDGAGRPDRFAPELRSAVEFLRLSRYVDGERISLAGHSMGAGAVLAAASRDPAIDGVVLIAGGWEISGPYRPANALFVHAEADLPGVAEAATRLSSQLAGVEQSQPRQMYGSFRDGTAVRKLAISGVDHASIVRSPVLLSELVGWLDGVYGFERSAPVDWFEPQRNPRRLVQLAILALLPALGVLLAGLAPSSKPTSPPPGPRSLLPLATGLAIAFPLAAWVSPGLLLGASDADRAVTTLAIAGLVWNVLSRLYGQMPRAALITRRNSGAVLLGALAIHLLLRPAASGLHDLALTPERALVALGIALVLLPLCLGLHLALRGGVWWREAGRRLAGRLLVLLTLLLCQRFGFLEFSGLVVALALVPTYILLELVLCAHSARGGDAAVAAGVEAVTVGALLAAILPVSL